MARGADDEAPTGPPQPPLLGPDPGIPWDAAATRAAMDYQGSGGRDDAGAPSMDMNIHQFMQMPGPWQRELLNKLVPPGSWAPIVPWDSNNPAGAPNLVNQLWYAAPETSRQRFLEPDPKYPDASFATAMLGPELAPKNTGGAPVPEVPYGQGEWRQEQQGALHPNFPDWRFRRLPLERLQQKQAEGRLYTPIDMAPFTMAPPAPPTSQRNVTGRNRDGSPIFGQFGAQR
jgi:hypothetical protein